MAIITVKCKCGESIKIDVKTIDELRNKLAIVTSDRDTYKMKLAALELKIASRRNSLSDLLGGGFF